LQIVKLWGQTSVDAEDFVVDYGRDWETVEALDKLFPQLQRIPPFALIVEPINPINGPALVISSQKEEILGVLNLVGEEQADHLQILLASVHVVTQE